MTWPTLDAKRAYQRAWARARRDAKRGRAASHCPIDGALLRDEIDRLGRLVVRCQACERRRARQCMDCGRPVEGRAWRCPMHLEARATQVHRIYTVRHRARKNEAEKARYHRDPAYRARRNAYKKRWRERNPMKVAMHKRKARLSGRQGWATREAYLQYHATYNAARAAEKREYMRRRGKWYGTAPTCRRCGGPVPFPGTGRPRLDCYTCRPMSARERARQATAVAA